MNLLIIGSKGFIGSHAYHYFKNNATYKTWACDVVADYVDERYFTLESSNSDFNELFEKIPFDVCINCSGAASVPGSLKNPLRDFSLNTLNVIKVLEAIRRYAPECKFINMSSAAVYGNPQNLPIKEISSSNPISPYGQHKLFAEELCKEYHNFFGIKTCSLRIFSAYGPGLMKQLLWDWYQKSKDSGLVNIYGTGNESRDFIYIDDLVQVIELAILNSDFKGSVTNVANGKEVYIKDAANIFLGCLDKKYLFEGEVKQGDPINWVADITEIKKWGYINKVKLDKGFENYIEWLKGLN
jgi:UDP-glucose 4-epimerase